MMKNGFSIYGLTKRTNVKRILLAICVMAATVALGQSVQPQAQQKFGFIQNAGQVYTQDGQPNEAVKFILLRQGLNVQVRSNGFSYDTYTTVDADGLRPDKRKSPREEDLSTPLIKYHRVDITFPHANPGMEVVAGNPASDNIRYIGGKTIKASHFESVLYKNIYNGIDLKLYTNEQGAFEYDFVVHPGADASQITMSFAGQNSISRSSDRALDLSLSTVKLREEIPISYIASSRQSVNVTYKLSADAVSFNVPTYDPKETLVIDPSPNLIWGTYYGGPDNDYGTSVAQDGFGGIYYAGYTSSANSGNVIATSGGYQTSLQGGQDGFFVKFDGDGVRQFSTYFGGFDNDQLRGILSDGTNIYVAGHSLSTGLGTLGVEQQFNNGDRDMIIAKFDSFGNLAWCTYFGGAGDERAFDITLNELGNPVVAGMATSSNLPMTWQTTFGGATDAVIAAFDANTGDMQYGSYFGGVDDDGGFKLISGSGGNIHLVGWTNSAAGIATAGSHQETLGGDYDGYVAKFNNAGAIQWATYYGGVTLDEILGVGLDVSENVYIAGYTTSSVGISTPGAHQENYTPGGTEGYDGYVAKLNNLGQRLWGTYYGGNEDDMLWTVVGDDNYAFVAGSTASTTGIATIGSYQPVLGGWYDVAMAKFTGSGSLEWGTYYGGNDLDEALYNIVDAGRYIIAGYTYSNAGIASYGHQSNRADGADGFLASFDDGNVSVPTKPTISDISPPSGAVGSTVTIYGSGFGANSLDNIVFFGSVRATVTFASFTQLDVTVPNGSTFLPITVTTPGGLSATSLQPFVVTLSNADALSSSSFADRQDFGSADVFTNGVVAADFDGDGKTDVAVTNGNSDNIRPFLNSSVPASISLSPQSPVEAGIAPQAPVVVDWDGDGKLDIVATSPASSQISIYRNISAVGGISFDLRFNLGSSSPRIAAVGDIDGDGKPDLVVTNINESTVTVFRNTSSPGAVSGVYDSDYNTQTTPYGVQLADMDRDGKLDIIVANFNSNTVSVLRNNTPVGGFISFENQVVTGTNAGPWMLAIADYDQDGLLDIAVTCTNSNTVSFLRNVTSGSTMAFSFTLSAPAGFAVSGITADDLDGDGYADVVVSNVNANTITVLRNDSFAGSLSFSGNSFPTGAQPHYTLAIADIDGDGKKDILVPNSNEHTLSILRNQIVVFTPEPLDQPSGFVTTDATSSEIISAFFPADSGPDGYLVLSGGSNGFPTAIPQDNQQYNVGDFLNGNDYVIAVGPDTTFSESGLPPLTTIHYNVYSYNGAGSATNYNTFSPLQGVSTTAAPLANEPTAQPTNFNTLNATRNSLNVTFSPATGSADGYFALRSTGADPDTPPSDGVTYVPGDFLGNAIVAYVGSINAFEDLTLSENTTYTYAIYSFNGSGSTINYLTASPLVGNGATNDTPLNVPSAFGTINISNGSTFYSVRFISPSVVLAGGTGGTILRSTNGGTSWTNASSPTGNVIFAMDFTSSTSGFAVGGSGLIMSTTDGGSNWNIVSSPTSSALLAVYMVPGTQVGYAVGQNGVGIKTIDGGANWFLLPNMPVASSYTTVYFRNVDQGIASGPDGVVVTNNGGASWASPFTAKILAYHFPNTLVGYGVGEGGIMVKSIDAGDSWFALESGINENLFAVHFLTASIGFAVGEGGTILKTIDGGTTWSKAMSAATDDVNSVHFGSSQNGIVVGNSGYIAKAENAPSALTVSHTPVTIVSSNQTVRPSISFGSEFSRVTPNSVKFRTIGLTAEANGIKPDYTVGAITGAGNSFEGNISNDGDEQIGHKYWFVYEYDARFGRKDSTQVYYVYEQFPLLEFPALKTGTTDKDYQLISVPAVLQDAKVSSIFGPADKKSWRIFSASGNETEAGPVELLANESLVLGEGYWFITKNPKNPDLGAGTAYNAKASDPFKFNFSRKGYHLIGNPYNKAVQWQGGSKVKGLRAYNNGTWAAASAMDPFKGYFVDVEVADSYSVPLSGPFNGARTKELRIEQDENSWKLPIALEQNGLRNEMGGIGMHPEASLGRDQLDERVFPMPDFFSLASLSVDRPEAGTNLEWDYVTTTTNQTWEFTLKARGESAPVTMSWDPALIASVGRDLYLFDEEAIALIDMQTVGIYQARTNTRLKIITGDAVFVQSEVKFGESRIGNLYPNPTSETGFSVPVAMRSEGEVLVRIVDTKGAEVASQVHFASKGMQNISISGLPGGLVGLYLVTTETADSGRRVQKVIFK
jgi:photosystem II stability/assembly factor-like uncharacterized protein